MVSRGQDQRGRDRENTQDDTPDAPSGGQDARVAEQAGLVEGELKRLRLEAGLNLLAGHEGNVLAWESTREGQEFLRTEDDRQKEIEKEAQAVQESAEQVSDAERRYAEAVQGARRSAVKQAKDAEKSR